MLLDCVCAEHELDEVVNTVAKALAEHKLLLLVGEVGAGKTTLVKLLAKKLGSTTIGSSPTFSLINEYPIANQSTLYHLDLYRLNDAVEVYDIGLEEILDSNQPTIIEWPELALDLIDTPYLQLNISHLDGKRKYKLALIEYA